MTVEEFVQGVYKEKEDLLETYFNSQLNTKAAHLLKALKLDDNQKEIQRQLLDVVLTDSFYSLLLGLDGTASIGGRQELYKLLSENGNELTCGEIEGYAWEYFHEKSKS